MRSHLVKALFLAAVLFVTLAGVVGTRAQDSPQKEAASKTAKFETVAKTDALYTGAMDAHDLDGGRKLIGKEGSFKGKVTKAFSPRSGTVLILNFDNDYKKALTAVVNKADFGKFPDLSHLEGKEVVITGKFIDFHDAPEIVLTDLKQILVVK